MNWSDVIKLPEGSGVAAAVLVPVVGLVVWVVRQHVQHLNASIRGLRQELDATRVERDSAETRAAAAVVARDAAEHARAKAEAKAAGLEAENVSLRAGRDHWRAEHKKILTAGQQEHVRRKVAEKHAAEAAGRATRLQDDLAAALTGAASAAAEAAQARADRGAAAASLTRSKKVGATLRRRLKQTQAQLDAVARHDARVWVAPVPADAPPFVPLATRKVAVVAVLNLKGGVGKTTIAANLAGVLGAEGRRVLLVDLDYQRSLSLMLLSNADRERLAEAGRAVQHVLLSTPPAGSALVAAAEKVPGIDNCWLVTNIDPREGAPADGVPGLDDLETRLMAGWLAGAQPDVRFLLRAALHADAVREHFDVVLIDCPPRLTTACVNAIAAADVLLVPVQPEGMAARSVPHLLRRLRGFRKAGVIGPGTVAAVVANMAPERATKPDSTEAGLMARMAPTAESAWGSPVRVFSAGLQRLIQYADASASIEVGGRLKLAIEYQAVRKAVAAVANELTGVIDASRGPAGVPV